MPFAERSIPCVACRKTMWISKRLAIVLSNCCSAQVLLVLTYVRWLSWLKWSSRTWTWIPAMSGWHFWRVSCQGCVFQQCLNDLQHASLTCSGSLLGHFWNAVRLGSQTFFGDNKNRRSSSNAPWIPQACVFHNVWMTLLVDMLARLCISAKAGWHFWCICWPGAVFQQCLSDPPQASAGHALQVDFHDSDDDLEPWRITLKHREWRAASNSRKKESASHHFSSPAKVSLLDI